MRDSGSAQARRARVRQSRAARSNGGQLLMTETYTPPTPNLPPLAERTVPAVLSRALARSPDKIAVEEPGRALSYHETVDLALEMAGGFERLGVGRQEPVLLMLDNHLDYVLAWLSLSLTGRIEVPVNTAYVGAILAHVIGNCGARVMVTEARYLPAIAEAADRLDRLETLIVRGEGEEVSLPSRITRISFASLRGPKAEMADVKPWDLIGIMYTSGTTGLSKGVRVTHAHAYGYATPEVYGACGESDKNLVVLPLFHVGGQWKGVYNALIAGASAAVFPRFSAQSFWSDVRAYGCTYTLMLGVMAEFLLRQPELPTDREHPLKRAILVPVPSDLEGFRRRFGIETISSAYGSTEGSVVLLSPLGGAEPGMIGWCRPDFEAKLVDENDIEVPPGASGELVIRAREPWVVMAGYHGAPEATEEAWRNLWLHTGDVMRKDSRGMYAFIDRRRDAIRRRGENISSFEVEQEIMAHPDVLECAVVAVASDATEDDILACVVRGEGSALDGAALRAHLKPRLPYFMVPRYIRFIDSLPKTPTAKVRKQALRDEGVTSDTFDANAK
jgi:crotonobetaine/carnitine-CoA ligase